MSEVKSKTDTGSGVGGSASEQASNLASPIEGDISKLNLSGEGATSTKVLNTSPPYSPLRKLLKNVRQKYIDDEEVQELCDEVVRMSDRINTLKKQRDEAVIESKNAQFQKNLVDRIKFCNIYRKQVERYETIFGKNQTFQLLGSFQKCFDLMLPFYVKERNADHNRKPIDLTPPKKATIFRDGFTRVEKWRLIGLWIFAGEIAPTLPEEVDEEYGDFILELNDIRTYIAKNSKQLQQDYEKVHNKNLLRPLDVLKEFFTKTLTMANETDVQEAVMVDLIGDARAFNDAFQSCSKELKKVEDLVATPTDYETIRVPVDPNEVDDHHLVVQCLDMMVTIGLQLAVSTVKMTSP